MTYTPDEARRALTGEVIVSDGSVLERLERELAAGVYAANRKQENAISRLLRDWQIEDEDRTWFLYLESKEKLAAQMDVKTVYDKVNDFDFWVRALGACQLFACEPYAAILKVQHERRRQAA